MVFITNFDYFYRFSNLVSSNVDIYSWFIYVLVNIFLSQHLSHSTNYTWVDEDQYGLTKNPKDVPQNNLYPVLNTGYGSHVHKIYGLNFRYCLCSHWNFLLEIRRINDVSFQNVVGYQICDGLDPRLINSLDHFFRCFQTNIQVCDSRNYICIYKHFSFFTDYDPVHLRCYVSKNVVDFSTHISFTTLNSFSYLINSNEEYWIPNLSFRIYGFSPYSDFLSSPIPFIQTLFLIILRSERIVLE